MDERTVQEFHILSVKYEIIISSKQDLQREIGGGEFIDKPITL
jgi:hypothetical protein